MKNFFANPIVHGIVAGLIVIGSLAVAHLGTLGDVTVSAVLIGTLKWLSAENAA